MLLLPLLVTLALPTARAFPEHLSTFLHKNIEGAGKCVSDSHNGHVHGEPESEMAAFFDVSQTRLAWPNTPQSDFDGVPSPPLEIQPLVVSGPSSNRVDLVFFSDGYLQEEREKFIQDATRLASDISSNQTFDTVKPLMNFWAAFTPSKESGVGVGGKPKDTAFGLYRPGTELRGVYYAKPEVAGAACSSLGDQCDYPILLGNDPLYGGLGGRFTVITPSLANGASILRHELGHSIIKVGEEYDGGEGYFGVNAHADLSTPVPWAHWLTNSTNVRVERSVMPMQDYAWALLNTTKPWSVTFESSGTFARHLVRFSVSGLPEAADLQVDLDGTDLGWVPRANIGLDRWHYNLYREGGLSGGPHTLTFTLLNGARVPAAQMCNAEILEFGDESEFVSTPGHYSLYPTFSFENVTTYRPTNEDCLMRLVTTPNFCKACLEGLWLKLLRDVTLIDTIDESCAPPASSGPTPTSTLTLRLVPLAQFRTSAVAGLDESYTVTWSKDGVVLPAWTNKTQVDAAPGTYAVDVKYTTTEVRVDPTNLLTAHMNYTVSESSCTRA
ncbi:IgA peptidase M64-domain-containing protein [Mycena maculata]|uniref:IgA peptidase M64-domain-containing protein n=1 Tax=Mycena maculata TaxID=230809 RepID=A0AAD7JJX1_9AGAR|nr:IgA peptidase M64-domain-containing protein [Mycena maculata]